MPSPMTYEQAQRKHEHQWQGETYVFPYDHRYIDDQFITVSVPIHDCRCQAVIDDKVTEYSELILSGEVLPPSWVTYGKRLKNKQVVPFWHGMLYVVDGNHRLTAQKLINKTKVEVVIPNSDYRQYMRKHNENS